MSTPHRNGRNGRNGKQMLAIVVLSIVGVITAAALMLFGGTGGAAAAVVLLAFLTPTIQTLVAYQVKGAQETLDKQSETLEQQDAKLETVATAAALEQVHINTNSRLDQAQADADAANARLYAVMEELRRVNTTGVPTPTTRTREAPPVTMDLASGAVKIEGEKIPPPPAKEE